MPAPITNGESGSSVRSKINAAFVELAEKISSVVNLARASVGIPNSELGTTNIAGTDTDTLFGVANNANRDMRIRIKAGDSVQGRAYFDWRNASNANTWLAGVNAGNAYITYDSPGLAHRLDLLTGSHSFVSSAGSGSVIVNGHSDNGSGTGGLIVRSGGASPSDWHQFLSSGAILRGPVSIRDTNGTTELHLLGTAAGSNIWTGTSGAVHTLYRNNQTAETNQTIRLGGRNYASNGGTPSALLTLFISSSVNELQWGGGTGAMNAATVQKFYAAANNTSGSGTEIARVTLGGIRVQPAGVGGNVVASAAIQIDATDKGFLPPRMTTAQRDAISSPAEGLVIYNTTTQKLNFRNATAWEQVG